MQKEVLYKYGRYIVVAIDNYQTEHGKIKDGYALYNVETDVIEGEHEVLFFIIQKAIQFENALREVLKFNEDQQEQKHEKEKGWGEVLRDLDPPASDVPPQVGTGPDKEAE